MRQTASSPSAVAATRHNARGSDIAVGAHEAIAAQIHEAFADQEFSIVDRTSWSIMRRLGVLEAISFDRDYLIYRFGRDRRQAFTVHA